MTVFSKSFVDSTGTVIPNLSSLKGSLTREEEVAYFRRWQENPNDRLALDKLQSVCAVYIDYEANRRKGYGVPIFDLVQEGVVGFMKALNKYDPDHDVGARFASYAVHWIKAEMDEYVLRNVRPLKMATTKDQRKLFFKFRSVVSGMMEEQQSLTEDQIGYIAETLEVSVKSVKQMEARFHSQNYISMDTLEDFGRAEGSAEDVQDLEDQSVRQALFISAVSALDDRKRDILLRRYPSDGEKATLQDLADHYDVSAERIRQLEKQAIKAVKDIVARSGYESVAMPSPESEFLVVHSSLNAG